MEHEVTLSCEEIELLGVVLMLAKQTTLVRDLQRKLLHACPERKTWRDST